MDDPDLKLLFGAIILIVFGVVGWAYRDQLFGQPEPEPVVAAPAAAEPLSDGGPRHPMPETTPVMSGSGELVPLPPLDDSDAGFAAGPRPEHPADSDLGGSVPLTSGPPTGRESGSVGCPLRSRVRF